MGESPLLPNAEMEAMVKKMNYGLIKVCGARTAMWARYLMCFGPRECGVMC